MRHNDLFLREVFTLVRKPASGKGAGGTKPGTAPALSRKALPPAEKIGSGLLLAVLVLTVALALAAPFREGIFRPADLLIWHGFTFALFGAWWAARLLRRESGFTGLPPLCCLLVMALCYGLAIFGAVDRRAAVGELLKVLNCLALFMLAADLGRRRGPAAAATEDGRGEAGGTAAGVSWAAVLLHALLAAALLMTLGSLGAATGVLKTARVYVDGRLWTTLGYANAAAAYLGAAAFLALALGLGAERVRRRAFYNAAAALFLTAAVLTLSRGTWLLWPVLAAVMLLAAGAANRARLLSFLLLVALTGVGTGLFLDRALRAEAVLAAWGLIALAPAAAAALTFPLETFLGLERRRRTIILAAGAALVLIATGLGAGVVARRLGAPLHLSGSDDARGRPYLDQVIDRAGGGVAYTLSLEVNAGPEAASGGAAPEIKPETGPKPVQAWRLLVRSGGADYALTTVLDHHGGPTAGWQEQRFTFTAPADSRRLEIRVYGGEAGTAVTARHGLLEGGGQKTRLDFTWNRLLPEAFYRRIFSFGDRVAAVLRLDHYRLAWRMIGDRPLLGAGGGGWKALYLTYQDRPYWTSEVHCHYLQLWVEAGLFALLAYLGLWFFVLRDFWRFSRAGDGGAAAARTHRLAAFISAVTIGVHSAIDYDLSLGAVNIFLFILLGVGAGLGAKEADRGRAGGRSRRRRKAGAPGTAWRFGLAGLLAAAILTALSWSLFCSYRLRGEAAARAAENRIPETVALLRQAARWDPWQGESYFMLAMVYTQVADRTAAKDPEAAAGLLLEGLELARRAQEMAPYDAAANYLYGQLLLRCGFEEEGLAYMDRLIELNPLVKDHYARLAQARLDLAAYYLEAGEEERAAVYLRQIPGLAEKMSTFHGEAALLDYYRGRAFFLLGETGPARLHLERVRETDEHYREAQDLLAQMATSEAAGG